MTDPEFFEGTNQYGIRDSLNHQIPPDELNPRTHEMQQVLEAFRHNPLVILTADTNGSGKSTFASILRDSILTGRITEFGDCLFMEANSIFSEARTKQRQGRFDRYDRFSYPQLLRFSGLIIFDEVHPDQFPLVDSITRANDDAKVLTIVQPVFLKSPYDDSLHERFAKQAEGIPVVRLVQYSAK